MERENEAELFPCGECNVGWAYAIGTAYKCQDCHATFAPSEDQLRVASRLHTHYRTRLQELEERTS